MTSQEVQFQPVPGARGAEVYSYLRKPHVLSSNSYLVRTSETIAVIDPGGLEEQTEILAGLVREELVRKERPVYVLLTHCHLDHCREAIRPGFWQQLPGLKVAIHERGARALAEADHRLTQEEILGGGLESYEADLRLFSRPPQSSPSRESLSLGGSIVIEARPLPGHSPDGVVYRLGKAIFVGDLLTAVTPLIAGAPGWHREDLIASLREVLGLVESGEIEACFPGHGPPLSAEELVSALQRALTEADSLAGIETADAARVKYVSGRARELFEELSAAFTLIRERLNRLAGRLDYLEEWSAARRIAGILDSKEVARLLEEFRNFSDRFRSGRKVETQVALKAVQLVRRISGLLDYEGLAEVLDPTLLRLTRGLIEEYLVEVRGFRPEGEGEEVDAEELLRKLTGEMVTGPGPAGLDEIPDDPDGFTRYLVRTLARPRWPRGLEVRVSAGPDQVLLPAKGERMADILRIMLQELSFTGVRTIRIEISPAP